MAIPYHILQDIRLERNAQDEQWGGPTGDDNNGPRDWCRFIFKQNDAADYAFMNGASNRIEWRSRMVKIAALAIAALESHDRLKAEDDAVEQGG